VRKERHKIDMEPKVNKRIVSNNREIVTDVDFEKLIFSKEEANTRNCK